MTEMTPEYARALSDTGKVGRRLRNENQKLREALREAREFFYDRADMETLEQGDVGNEEMRLLGVCDDALGITINRCPHCSRTLLPVDGVPYCEHCDYSAPWKT